MKQNIIQLEESFEKLKLNQSIENLDNLFIQICIYLDLNEEESPLILFETNNSNKKFITSWFLRIFNLCNELFWDDMKLRRQVLSLIDSIHSHTIYKTLGIKNDADSHEKFPILQPISNDSLSEFKKLNSSIVSLETSLACKQNYLKILSHPINTIFLEHQIYNQSLISKERIIQFFQVLENYTNASRIDKLMAFNRLQECYDSYITDLNDNYENEYSEIMIKNILNTIFNEANKNFNESELNKPAQLLISNYNRKYPLGNITESLKIKVMLENNGTGVAFKTKLNILDYDNSLKIISDEINIGSIDIGKNEIIIEVSILKEILNEVSILGIVSWEDYKEDNYENDFEIILTPQKESINWDEIKYKQPYSLSSIDKDVDFIGRKDLLENIASKLKLAKSESSILHGQKRVGKTSIARTIQSKFNKIDDFLTIFIETGSLDKTNPDKFLKTLGEKIVKQIKKSLNTLDISVEEFDTSLYPLVSFIEDIVIKFDNIKILIILDEFDEIPSQLYPYTNKGDAFFHNLRSICGESGEGRVSFILVGGENINIIMQSTDKLNKFDAFNVDYFNKAEYWDDFKELLIAPVKDTLEFEDEALLTLYDTTEGNPFYTKFIAKKLYKDMCDKHCSFITSDEMNNAINYTVSNLEAINVNHFWSDGIRVEDIEKRDLIETQRRRFLIAFAVRLRNKLDMSREEVLNDKSLQSIPAEEILDNFINRKILVLEKKQLRIKPRIFERWLINKGINTLRASLSDEDMFQTYQEKENELYIKDNEIIEISSKWELYKGSEISPMNIRSWLDQFENNREQRIALTFLSNLQFYGEKKIREKLSVIHEIIRKKIVVSVNSRERVRKDILLSCFGGVSKSGATYLRMYASENNISANSIKKINELEKVLLNDSVVKAIVFIDDITASGHTLVKEIKNLEKIYGDLLREKNILIVIGVICGLQNGIDYIEKNIDKIELNIHLKVCDIISDSDIIFNSDIFKDNKEEALNVARKYGSKLQSRHPLGYDNSKLLVVFKDNCPNNTLPIIWSTSNNPLWKPLFKRT